jgi:hypothetical protein
LDSEAFVNAVSCDLKEWVVGSEDMLSTHFEDVFGTAFPASVSSVRAGCESKDDLTTSDVEACANKEENIPLGRVKVSFLSRFCSCLWFILTLGELFGYCSTTDNQVFAVEPSNVDGVIDAHSSLVASVLILVFAVLT